MSFSLQPQANVIKIYILEFQDPVPFEIYNQRLYFLVLCNRQLRLNIGLSRLGASHTSPERALRSRAGVADQALGLRLEAE